jgi:hypothetical protein
MANQMIALGVRGPQVPDISRVNQQYGQIMNMMMQQRAAERQAAQAQQAMQIAAAEEGRKRDLHPSAMSEASAKATAAELKTGMDFNNFIRAAIASSATPDQVVGFADKIASLPQFQTPMYQDVLSRAVADMPRDPAQFEGWKKTTYLGTLEADKLYKQKIVEQNLGTSTRAISMSEFGGPATVVPGSEATVTLKPTGMNVEGLGAGTYDPNTNTFTPAAVGVVGTPPSVGGGSRGTVIRGGASPVATALQTNPGALKDGAFARSQPGYTGNSGGFATFSTPQAGIAAQENLLRSAYVGRGFNTIDKIVNRYAPQGPENSAASVNNYKRYISQQTGIDINSPISTGQIPAVAQAMREFETGQTKGRGAAGTAEPRTTSQTASAMEKQRKVRTFQEMTGVNLDTQLNVDTDPVSKLIKGSTSGAIEAVGAEIKGALPESMGGGATPGMKNIGQLETIATTLTLAFAPDGRLSTGVSNEDRRVIERQLGVIQDPMIPSGKRLAAWGEVKRIMARTIGMTAGQPAAPTGGGKKRKPISEFGR